MSYASTRGVEIAVDSVYVPERSNPAADLYFFAYQVTITNHGAQTVQLMSRHWVISDANGNIEEVVGDGVVGQTPVLRPGEHFRYTSACPLTTPVGSMHGTYRMAFPGDATLPGFDAEIARFTLAVPGILN